MDWGLCANKRVPVSVKGKNTQDNCTASYDLCNGDGVINSKAREEIGGGRDEDVPVDVWLDQVRPCQERNSERKAKD